MAIQRNKSFQRRVFISFFSAFCIFATAVLLFQYEREKEYRVKQLETTLDNITAFTHNFIEQNKLIENRNFSAIDSLVDIFPNEKERITIVDVNGVVLYDSFVKDLTSMENHLQRPEIQKALYSGIGNNIRKSATTQQEFYYYARNYQRYFVRTALVYDIQVQNFLKTTRVFIFFIIALFALMWIILNFVTRHIGSFVTQLKDFSVKAAIGEEIETEASFSDDELETISQQIKKNI